MLPKLSNLFSKKDNHPNDAQDAPPPPPQPGQAVEGTPPPPVAPQGGDTPAAPAGFAPGMLKPPGAAPQLPAAKKKRITQRLNISIPQTAAPQAPAVPGGEAPVAEGGLSIPKAAPLQEDSVTAPIMGTVDLPIRLVLPALPPEALNATVDNLLGSPEAAGSVKVPLASILNMLPSGKLEFTVKEFSDIMPGGLLKPSAELGDLLQSSFTLPLPEVVQRIPPEHLSLRADQKPVDEKVVSMKDPFSEEFLKKQAQEKAAAEAVAAAPPAPVQEQAPPPPAEEPQASGLPPLMPEQPVASPQPASPPPVMPVAPVGETPPPPVPGAVPQSPAPPPPMPRAEEPVVPLEPPAPSIPAPAPVPAMPQSPPKSMASETIAMPNLSPEAFEPDKPQEAPEPPAREPQAESSPASAGGAAGLPDLAALAAAAQAGQPEEQPEPEAPAPVSAPQISAQAQEAVSFDDSAFDASSAEKKEEPSPPAPEPAQSKEESVIADAFSFTPLSPPEEKESELPQPPPQPEPEAIKPEPESSPEPAFEPVEEPPSVTYSPDEVGDVEGAVAHLNSCGYDELLDEVGCGDEIARRILAYRELYGVFRDRTELWKIPGMTQEAYRHLVGLPSADSPLPSELNEALGYEVGNKLTVQQVAAKVRQWPYITACIIGGMEGLPIAYECDDESFARTICAFVPRLLRQTTEVLSEVKETPAREIHLVKDDKSLWIFRSGELFLVVVNGASVLSSRETELIRQLLRELARTHSPKVEV